MSVKAAAVLHWFLRTEQNRIMFGSPTMAGLHDQIRFGDRYDIPGHEQAGLSTAHSSMRHFGLTGQLGATDSGEVNDEAQVGPFVTPAMMREVHFLC